jgi:hypothetical protein
MKEETGKKTALHVDSPPDRKSVYAPNRQDTEMEVETKKQSVVDVACGFVALTQDTFSSFSNSTVAVFVSEIRAASFEENLLGCHVVTIEHIGEDTSLFGDTLLAPKLLAFSEIRKISP